MVPFYIYLLRKCEQSVKWLSFFFYFCVCDFQDYKAGLAVAEVELTAANIRDVDRRGFEINTPFKNFWYVYSSFVFVHGCLTSMCTACSLACFCTLFPPTKSYSCSAARDIWFVFLCVWEKSALYPFDLSALTLTHTLLLISFSSSQRRMLEMMAPLAFDTDSFSQVDIVHLHICLNLTVGGCGMSRHDFQFSYKQILQDHLLILATQFRKCPYNKSLVTLYCNLRSHISQTIHYSYSKGWGRGF